MKLQAIQSFSPRGAHIIKQGETFTTNEKDAEILILNGMAKSLDDSTPTDEGNAIPVDYSTAIFDEASLQENTITELKKIAKNKSVKGYSTLSKSELIFAILAQQNANQNEAMEE